MEIDTREGKTDCQEIPNSGKQPTGRMSAFSLAHSPPKARGYPGRKPTTQHATVELGLSRNMSPFLFFLLSSL